MIVQQVILDILKYVYQAAGFATVIAILFMFFYDNYRKKGLKKSLCWWIKSFKTQKSFRKVLGFIFFTALIGFRTLLNRNLNLNPLNNVFGSWWIYNPDGSLEIAMLENILLFIPYSFLFLCVLEHYINGMFSTFKKGIVISFRTSCLIEILQLLFRVGLFQFSDIVYNTVGGLVGAIIYYLSNIIVNNRWRRKHNNEI